MPQSNTRYWTIPLTVLLFVNTVLVAFAARQVGIAGDSAPERVQAASIAKPAEPIAADPVITDPVVTDPVRAAPAEAAPLATEYSTTEDWPTADWPTVEEPGPGVLAIERPDVDVAPPTVQQPTVPRDILIFINPPATGGVVHFLLEGEVISLAPGELARVLGKGSRLVQFHRGDDFGDEELRAELGVFAFAISDRGWTLAEADDVVAARLLEVCKPVTPVATTHDASDDQAEF